MGVRDSSVCGNGYSGYVSVRRGVGDLLGNEG